MVQDLHLPALDKGWAWSILVAASIVLFCVNGTNRAESIAYQVVLVHLNGRPAVSALATGLHESLRFLLGEPNNDDKLRQFYSVSFGCF